MHVLDTIEDFLYLLGMKSCMYAAIENHQFFTKNMSLSGLPKLLRISVKLVHKCYLGMYCTVFTEVLNNFGRSNDDMV